jgi:hypothetical protein
MQRERKREDRFKERGKGNIDAKREEKGRQMQRERMS